MIFWNGAQLGAQLMHVDPFSSCSGRRAAVHSHVRPSSLQSICQSFELHSDTRVQCYATLRSVAQHSVALCRLGMWGRELPELKLLDCHPIINSHVSPLLTASCK